MTMDRRSVLKHIGGGSALATLAGCLSVDEQDTEQSGDGGSSDGSGDGGSDETATETSSPAGTGTVWYSLPDTELTARENVIEEFNDQSHHTIEGSDISEMEQNTTSSIPAGQGPELFEWAHDWVGDYYDRGFVVDQSDQLTIDLDVFTDAAADAVDFDGNVVGLPHSAETVTLIYNADIVDEAPETVDDMIAAMDDYHDPSNSQYGLGFPFDPYFASGWLQAFGGHYFDPEAEEELGVNSDSVVRGLQFALDNLTPYMPNDPGYEPQAAAFAEGNAAFAINGPWYLATLNDNDVNYEVTTFPELDDGEVSPYTGISMWYFAKAMEEDGPNAAAGRSFAEWYVTNEDHIIKNAEEQGAIPVLDSLVGSEELPSHVQAYSATVGQGIPMPTDPRMNKVWGPVETALIEAFNGDSSPQDALDTAADEIRANWE